MLILCYCLIAQNQTKPERNILFRIYDYSMDEDYKIQNFCNYPSSPCLLL
jgi:hypothetical protein